MPNMKAIIRLLEFRICLCFYCILWSVEYLIISEFVYTNTVQLFLFTVYLTEMLQNIIQQSFTVYIKYTLADATLF